MDATKVAADSWPSDETPIEDLDLWTRALNALRRGGVRTVGGSGGKPTPTCCASGASDLVHWPQFGP